MYQPVFTRVSVRTFFLNCVSAGVLAVVSAGAVLAQATAGVPAPLKYPASPRGAQSDDLNGVRVADPYRWLEAAASPDVQTWVAAQTAVTESYLSQIPGRAEMQDRVRRAWSYPKLGAPFAAAERLFFYENSGAENQSALYVQERAGGPARVLIDPNAMSHDGLVAIVDQAASPDGRFLAYAVSEQGSSWRTVRVRDVRSGQDVSDELRGIKESPLSWTKDARGFFYVRSDMSRPSSPPSSGPVEGHERVVYHRLGRPQADDAVVYENVGRPDLRLRADLSPDGEYLVIAARSGVETHNRLYLIDLDNPKRPDLSAPLVKLFDTGDALYEFVANQGPVFFIRTTKDAPRARLVAVDINTPDENHWTTIVRETFDPLVGVLRVDDRLVAHRLHDAHSVLELYALDGGVRGTVPLPGVGTVTELTERGEYREFYVSFSSFLQPATIYRFDLDSRSLLPYKDPRADAAFFQYETTQLFYTSKDGTRIPMFITARRGVTLDGTHATLLTADGAFNAPATPVFVPEVAAWLESGGIYAVANVRGGGDYGRAWHEEATGQHKQVTFDDFIAAAEFLINQRYTRPASLAIVGHGAGGLLAGVAMTQRPDLFGAVAIDAGLLDMTRFTRLAAGASWIPEFGNPEKPSDLRALLAYSPLQNVRGGTHYPPTLLSVGDHDDVVSPAHTYKFAAALQATLSSGAPSAATTPILLRVEHDAGFGPGTPTSKQLALDVDRLAFLGSALHVPR